jgi:hypothetical protein
MTTFSTPTIYEVLSERLNFYNAAFVVDWSIEIEILSVAYVKQA